MIFPCFLSTVFRENVIPGYQLLSTSQKTDQQFITKIHVNCLLQPGVLKLCQTDIVYISNFVYIFLDHHSSKVDQKDLGYTNFPTHLYGPLPSRIDQVELAKHTKLQYFGVPRYFCPKNERSCQEHNRAESESHQNLLEDEWKCFV